MTDLPVIVVVNVTTSRIGAIVSYTRWSSIDR
jgi:hypothetical protein